MGFTFLKVHSNSGTVIRELLGGFFSPVYSPLKFLLNLICYACPVFSKGHFCKILYIPQNGSQILELETKWTFCFYLSINQIVAFNVPGMRLFN